MEYKRKKIWLDVEHKKYCWVKLFRSVKGLNRYYHANTPEGSYPLGYDHTMLIRGANMRWIEVFSKSKKRTGCYGEVLLYKRGLGPGTVAHEFMHAVIWSHKNRKTKSRYPFVIHNIQEEEVILHNLLHALEQFNLWDK